MRILLSNIIYLLVFACLFPSCGKSYYIPSEAILLKLDEKGDMKFSAGVGMSDNKNTHLYAQAGYSPIQNFSVVGSYSQMLKNVAKEFSPRNAVISDGIHLEGALGWYKFIPLEKKDKNRFIYISNQFDRGFLFDAFLGVSGGRNTNYISRRLFPGLVSGEVAFDFNKYFIQGGAHYHNSIFKISYAARLNFLNYYKASIRKDVFYDELVAIDNINKYDPFVFLESTIGYEIGNETVRIKASYIFVHNTSKLSSIDPRNMAFNIGLSFDIDELLNKWKGNNKPPIE